MRVLFASSEAYPLAKTGGLADVSAALPMALTALGVDVRLVLPGYPGAIDAAANKAVCAEFNDFDGAGRIRIISARTPDTGLPIWLVDCPSLFRRSGGLYQDGDGRDWPDNALRFGVFSRIAARLALGEIAPGWRADVVHANDWHTGPLPALLAAGGGARPGTLFTMHNLAFQGLFASDVYSRLGFPDDAALAHGLEFYGKISFLKAGIQYSDRLTTVSPTYAREILTPDFGCGLDGLLRVRNQDLTGILNGVDLRVWDPATDRHLPVSYGRHDLAGKRFCKRALQRELGLATTPDTPLIIFVGRMTEQKMADVVFGALPALLDRGAQVAVLGEGDPSLERRFERAGRDLSGKAAVRIGYNEPIAHRFLAGADILLHPSRFEPCGLTQLYAMRYGTLPVATSIGGLADTVVDANDETIRRGTANGFSFEGASAANLISCVDRALTLYRQPFAWRKVQVRAMSQDFGWEHSARAYLELYRRLAPDAAPEVELGSCGEPPIGNIASVASAG